MREVGWTRRAIKDLRKLDSLAQERILTAVERLAESGVGDVRRLTGIKPPEWRLRVGDLRIRFQLASRGAVVILRVLPRDKAY